MLAPLVGVHVTEEKVERNRAATDRALQWLEDKFLGGWAFLNSQQVTLADLVVPEELVQVPAWPEEDYLWAAFLLSPCPLHRQKH